MTKDREANMILERAQELLRSGMNGGLTIRKSGRIEWPIPVLGSNRDLHSWFVPVTVDELLAGFFQFQPDLTLLRYSSFQRHEDSLEGCPAAELWTKPKAILGQIEKEVRQGEKVQALFLSYDKTLSRLAWAVVLEAPDETSRTLYVAGKLIWEGADVDAGGDSIDGF